MSMLSRLRLGYFHRYCSSYVALKKTKKSVSLVNLSLDDYRKAINQSVNFLSRVFIESKMSFNQEVCAVILDLMLYFINT